MWQDRVKKIIEQLAYQAYTQANTKKGGGRYKRHRPYSVPPVCGELLECLNNNDEERAKAIMMFNGDCRI